MNAPPTESRAAATVAGISPRWDAGRTEHNLDATRDRIRTRTRTQRVAVVVGAVTALAAAAALVLVLTPRTPPLAASAPNRDSQITTFGDGSTARIVGGEGRFLVQSAGSKMIQIALASGIAEFEVTPNPGRIFEVQAGTVVVRVLGTRFRVERIGPRARVAVERGHVEVTWPEGHAHVIAGESRWFPEPAAGETEARQPEPQPASAPTASAAEGASPPAPTTPLSEHERFLGHARRGEYDAAYAVLEKNADAVGSASEELMLAADTARLSGHPEQALPWLRRLLREHSHDSRAPLAAFTLGRILLSQLGRPGEAADAFALTRRLSPNGALAEDSLAREAQAALAAGDRGRASSLAQTYEVRYPSGRHLSAIQHIDDTTRP